MFCQLPYLDKRFFVAYSEVINDSIQKLNEDAEYYKKNRSLYYREWHWYIPEAIKYLCILIAAISLVT